MTHPLVGPLPLVASTLCCAISVGYAQGAEQKQSYNLPRGDATKTLNQFAEASGRHVVYMMDKVRSQQTNAIAGTYSPQEALDRMIAGTELVAVQDQATGAFVISRRRAVDAPEAGEEKKDSASPPNPKSMKSRTLQFLLAAWLAAGGNPADAQISADSRGASGEDEIVTLSPFTVSGTPENKYRASDSLSSARIRSALLDTPQSISVITREFLDDIGPTRIYDATRFVAGVTEGRGLTFSDRVILRGFENTGRTIDSIAFDAPTANIDESLIERIEILKGPSTILAPSGAPGGSMNILTKSPRFERMNSLTAQLGLFNAQKVTLDMTGPFSEGSRFAYRIIGTYQDSDLYWDDAKLAQKIIAPQLAFRASDTTEIVFKYTFADYSSWADPRVLVDSSVVNGAYAFTAPGFTRSGRNGSEEWGERRSIYNHASLAMNTAFTPHISMRLAVSYLYSRDIQYLSALSFPSTTNRYNPATGELTPNFTWTVVGDVPVATASPYYDPTNVARGANHNREYRESAVIQNDFAANYRFSGISSSTVAGWTIAKDLTSSKQRNATLPGFNLFAPVYGAVPVFPANYATHNSSESKPKQVYLVERLGFFDDRIYLNAGASRVWADRASSNLLTGAAPAVLKDFHDTYLTGALFKPTRNMSVYYSYTTNAAATTANNRPIWRDGQQHEFGAKGEFFEKKLSVTVARFEITQTNVSVPNPEFQLDPTQPTSLISDISNNGVEVEVTGALTKNLSIIAAGLSMKTRDSLGRRPRAIADKALSALLSYNLNDTAARGLSVFMGASYTGDSVGDAPPSFTSLRAVAQPSFRVRPYTVWNAGATYRWKQYTFRLNVDNLFNHHYLYSPGARFAVTEGPGTNIRLTAALRF